MRNLYNLADDLKSLIRGEKKLFRGKEDNLANGYSFSLVDDTLIREPRLLVLFIDTVNWTSRIDEVDYTGFPCMNDCHIVAEMMRQGDYGPALDYVSDLAYEMAK